MDFDEIFTIASDRCCLQPDQTIRYQTIPYQTKPYQTKLYQTKPTLNLLLISQNKLDFDEIFTVALDGCYLKPDQTKPYQTNFKSSLNQSKKLDSDELFTIALDGCCIQPDQTIPNQTLPN